MSFTDSLRRRDGALWDACSRHPFVLGIGDGSLPADKFRFYIRQDYLFLIDFCRVLALAVARADDLGAMGRYATLLGSTLNVEMELHRDYCARFGISREELEATRVAPATHAYTRHLLSVGQSGSLGEITAALIPCMCGYAETGLALATRPPPEQHPIYAEWIHMYASPEVQDLAAWLSHLLDRLAAEAGRAEQQRIGEVHLISSRYELMFWDAAWEMREWPV